MSQEEDENKKAKEDEVPEGKLAKAMYYWKKISHSLPYHIIQSLLSYLALITMIVALTVLAFPPHFNPKIYDGGKDLSIPAATRIFNLVHAAREKPELQNSTTYRFASQNGKYGLRVCTDLTEEQFEKATTLVETDRMWDNMDYLAIAKFKKNKCENSTMLSYNSNCNMRSDDGVLKGGAYYSIKNSQTAYPTRASVTSFPGKGQCGMPASWGGKGNLLFTRPDPGYGWLWTMMIRDPNKGFPFKFGGFPEDENRTHPNCTETICNKQGSKCDSNKGQVCYDEDLEECLSASELKEDRKTCSGPTMTNCTCSSYYEFIPGEPEWYKKGVEFKNEECQYGFGPLDANEQIWKKQRADAEPCLKKYVFGYGYTNKAITALFVIGAILRIGNQIMSFYWGCTEDDEDYKVLFTTETFFRIYSICTKGLDYVNEVIDTKWQTGWPWMIGFFDSAFVALATLGCAIGADPFPDLVKGRTTMFFLWISAIRECLKLLYKIYSAKTKKPWIIQQKSENVECCGKTIPWCGPVKEPEEDDEGPEEEDKGTVDPDQIELGEKK